jgi:hypothetical protein
MLLPASHQTVGGVCPMSAQTFMCAVLATLLLFLPVAALALLVLLQR